MSNPAAAVRASFCNCDSAAIVGANLLVSIPLKPAGTAPAPNLSIDLRKAVSEPSIMGAGLVTVVVVDIML